MAVIRSLEKIYAYLGGKHIEVGLEEFKLEFRFPGDPIEENQNSQQTEEQSKSIWFSAMGIEMEKQDE